MQIACANLAGMQFRAVNGAVIFWPVKQTGMRVGCVGCRLRPGDSRERLPRRLQTFLQDFQDLQQ